jgi:hypothetical protein
MPDKNNRPIDLGGTQEYPTDIRSRIETALRNPEVSNLLKMLQEGKAPETALRNPEVLKLLEDLVSVGQKLHGKDEGEKRQRSRIEAKRKFWDAVKKKFLSGINPIRVQRPFIEMTRMPQKDECDELIKYEDLQSIKLDDELFGILFKEADMSIIPRLSAFNGRPDKWIALEKPDGTIVKMEIYGDPEDCDFLLREMGKRP